MSELTAAEMEEKIAELGNVTVHEVERLAPLFKDEKEKQEFLDRHAKAVIPTADLASHKGKCYLGIDAGSTTTKACLINEKGEILYSFYK